MGTTDPEALETAIYGSTRAFYGIAIENDLENLYMTYWDRLMIVGTLLGKGMYTSMTLTKTSDTVLDLAGTGAYSGTFLTDSTNCSNGVCTMPAPTGGIAQFKGLA